MTPIPFTEGYFADESGNIYSTRPFKRSKQMRAEPVPLAKQQTPNGYNIVKVTFNGIRKSMAVGYLILLTFVSDRPKGHQVCHGVNGKADDSIKNISWGTVSKNNKEDKERDGKLLRGITHPNRKLNDDSIRKIRKLHQQKISTNEIAEMFKVHPSNIYYILRGKTWGHVK